MATIQNEDWNPVQDKIRKVLSTPDGTTDDLGYNTSYSSAQVSDNQQITGAQWNALRADVNKAFLLQTGSNSDVTTRDSTAIITSADLTAISGKVDTAYSNRGSVSTGQLTYVAGPSYSDTAAWTGTLTPISAVAITFADNAAFRGFWNGGGRLIFTGSRSGGSATSQNQGWTNLLANMGSIVLTRTGMSQSGQTLNWDGTFYNSFGSGGAYGTSVTTATEAFRIYSQETNYTSNYVQIYLHYNNTNVKLRTSVTITVYYADDHVGTAGGPDNVNGTTTCSCAIYYPYSTAKPNNY
jgi:hypothetical protein